MTVIASVTTVTPAVGLLLTTAACCAPPPASGRTTRPRGPRPRCSGPQAFGPNNSRSGSALIEQRYGWAVLITMKAGRRPARARPRGRKSFAEDRRLERHAGPLSSSTSARRRPSRIWSASTAPRSTRTSAERQQSSSIGKRPGTASGPLGKRPAARPNNRTGSWTGLPRRSRLRRRTRSAPCRPIRSSARTRSWFRRRW